MNSLLRLSAVVLVAGATQLQSAPVSHGSAPASGCSSVGVHSVPAKPGQLVVEFGYTSQRPPSSSVRIYASGRVKIAGPLRKSVVAKVTLSRSSVVALVRLAEASRFFCLPGTLPGTPTPDVPTRYIDV